MRPHWSQRLAWLLFALSIGLLVASIVLASLNGFAGVPDWGTGVQTVIVCMVGSAFGLVGALITVRYPANAVGWICLATGVGWAAHGAVVEYAVYAVETDPGVLPGGAIAAWIGDWVYVPSIGLPGVYLVLLFPTGRPISSRWHIGAWAGGVALGLWVLARGLSPGLIFGFPSVRNPVGLEGPAELLEPLGVVSWVAILVCFIASAISMVFRFRWAHRVEREQLKWFALAVGLVVIPLLPVIFAPDIADPPLGLRIVQDLATLSFAALPVAVGIAILRYRLYDIDLLINRTIVYTVLTAVLGLVYLGGVVGIGGLVREVTSSGSNDLVIATTTLVIAALSSGRRAPESRASSTGASLDASTTRPKRSRPFPHGSGTRSTWRPCPAILLRS